MIFLVKTSQVLRLIVESILNYYKCSKQAQIIKSYHNIQLICAWNFKSAQKILTKLDIIFTFLKTNKWTINNIIISNKNLITIKSHNNIIIKHTKMNNFNFNSNCSGSSNNRCNSNTNNSSNLIINHKLIMVIQCFSNLKVQIIIPNSNPTVKLNNLNGKIIIL